MGLFDIFKMKEQFKIGDGIICIDDRNWNKTSQSIKLIFRKKYIIKDILIFNGDIKIDIGCRFDNPKKYTYENGGLIAIPGQGIHWAGHFRFAKSTGIEESCSKEEIQSKIESLVKEENYEEAAILQKQLEEV